MRKINHEEYTIARNTVREYEERESFLFRIGQEIKGILATEFKAGRYKFSIDSNKRTVTFAGFSKDKEIRLGIAKCLDSDVFDVEIGQYVAVMKAFGRDFTDAYNYIIDADGYRDGKRIYPPVAAVFGSVVDNIELSEVSRHRDSGVIHIKPIRPTGSRSGRRY